MRLWGLLLFFGLGISGILWGSTAIFLFPVQSLAHQVFIAFTLAGMTAGAVAVFSPIMPVFLAFIIPALAPIIVRFVIIFDMIHLAMAAMVTLFAILSFRTAQYTNKSTRELIILKENFADRLDTRTFELKNTNELLKQEIKERKHTEEELHKTSSLLQEMALGTDDLIAAQDLEFRYLFVNEAYCREMNKLFGVHIEVGMSTMEMLIPWPEDKRKTEAVWRPALEGKSFSTTESFGPAENEQIYDIRTYPLRDEHGKVFGAAQIARNITKQVNTQKALERQTEELATVNRELEAFSYSLSHDLRAPLRALVGFSSLLHNYADQLDGKANEYLQRITAGAKKMNLLIDNMLRLSRISRQEVDIQEIDLSFMAKAVVHELEQQHQKKHVELHVADGLKVQGDAQLIRIALTNLISNALKYTSKTTGAHVEFGSYQKNGKKVFFIRDNGAGFPMEQADRLFQPFQRLHSESEFSGTGIGLPIVERVIKRHGGEIWAEGEVGKGAVFYFTLPAER